MIEAVPLLLAVGVKVAVRMRPVPETVERVPPARVMSALVKEAPGSRLKEKEMVVDSPALRAERPLVMVTVGVVGVPLRLAVVEARKKAARSLVEAERISPKPGLSALFALV